jgi:hypothetical protein
MPRKPARPTTHKYPSTAPDTADYLVWRAPRSVLQAAQARAASEEKSLRVVLLDFLTRYAKQ